MRVFEKGNAAVVGRKYVCCLTPATENDTVPVNPWPKDGWNKITEHSTEDLGVQKAFNIGSIL